MSYNVKNYTEQGGEKTVIGGILEITEDATVTGLPSIPKAENRRWRQNPEQFRMPPRGMRDRFSRRNSESD